MQALPRGIKIDAHLVFKYRKLYLMLCARFLKIADAVHALKALDTGFFDYSLAVGYRVQLRIQTAALDRERICLCDKVLPANCPYALEKLLKALCLERCKLYQDSLACGYPQVRLCKRIEIAVKAYLAVGGKEIFAAYLFDLVCHNAFQAEMARHAQSQILHTIPSRQIKPPLKLAGVLVII